MRKYPHSLRRILSLPIVATVTGSGRIRSPGKVSQRAAINGYPFPPLQRRKTRSTETLTMVCVIDPGRPASLRHIRTASQIKLNLT